MISAIRPQETLAGYARRVVQTLDNEQDEDLLDIQKEIGYSYPTSDNAKRFGFYQQGCYTVSIIRFYNFGRDVAEELVGFRTMTEAVDFAKMLPYAKNHYSIDIYAR